MFDQPEQRGQVDKAIKALRLAGARTGEKPGIHVHIDATDLTASVEAEQRMNLAEAKLAAAIGRE